MNWQPIDTAPHDGTIILIADRKHITAASWIGGGWTEGEKWEPACQLYSRYVSLTSFDPTYWMLLPDLPGGVYDNSEYTC